MNSLHRAEDIAAEIKRRVALCTVAQGAETDLGTRVFQGRRAVDDSMPPCATIIEADDTPARGRVRDEYEISQRYIVFAYVPCAPDNPNIAAHAAIRDLKRAMFAGGDFRFGGLVKIVEYVGRDIGPRADGAAFVVAAIELVVTYVERLSNP
jgi:hypothetical protein